MPFTVEKNGPVHQKKLSVILFFSKSFAYIKHLDNTKFLRKKNNSNFDSSTKLLGYESSCEVQKL